MRTTRVTLTLPTELVEEARRESTNLSQLIAEALADFLHRRRIERALQAFGAWSRPEDFDSVAFVEALRSEPMEGRLAD
ncbi:type II toxin-antitoxin system CcdA family antitoxin [Thermoflexus hugenholtzii]|jgi:Post-segregation antitoxin CcdA.